MQLPEFVQQQRALLLTNSKLLWFWMREVRYQPQRRGVGDLVLVYRRVTGLAGHTSRVAELLEQVQRLSNGDPETTTRTLYNRNVSSSKLLADLEPEPLPEPRRHEGTIIKFHRCAPCGSTGHLFRCSFSNRYMQPGLL